MIGNFHDVINGVYKESLYNKRYTPWWDTGNVPFKISNKSESHISASVVSTSCLRQGSEE